MLGFLPLRRLESMISAGDITDALQLLTTTGTCSCCSVPTSQTSRLCLRRACIASSQRGDYVIDTVTTVSPGSGGYAVGDYVQINDCGMPNLLVQVRSVTSGNTVIAVTPVNQPVLTADTPLRVWPSTNLTRSGSGATFRITVKRNPAVCCTCSVSCR